MAAGRELIDLTQKQLLKLAELIHLQEVEKLREIDLDFGQQQHYLNSCKEAYEKTKNLLDAVQTMKDQAEGTKMSIANDIFEYSKMCIGISLQFIRSYNSRIISMDKLSAHSTDMIHLLNSLEPATQVEEAARLAAQAAMYKDFMLDYARKVENFVPNLFTRWIKETGKTVDDLVVEYMGKLGLEGSFEQLTDIQKLQVYESVIKAAGQGLSVLTYSYEALGTIGVAVLVFTAATMVWHIATADYKLETAARDAVNVLLGVVKVSEIASAAIGAGFQALDMEVASAMITVMGSIVGFGVGALIGVAAGALLDLIFTSGKTKVKPSDGLTVCLVAPMPDGLELARLIKYNYPPL